MQQIIHNPVDGIYAAAPDHVHALEVRRSAQFPCIAGTMGLRPDVRRPKTFDEQLKLICANIRTILAQANMPTNNIVRITTHRDSSYAAANGAARERALGTRRRPTTAIVVQTLDPEWLVEIEAIATA